MSTRFYCPETAQSGTLRLGSDESRHMIRVCRLGVGDVVEVFDGKGHATRAEIVRIEHGCVELAARGLRVTDPSPPVLLTLASAVPKGDRFDWLVEKATELGVSRLIPLVTERSVVDPGTPKLDRLRKVIIEASKQCGRNRLMTLDAPMHWDQLARLHTDSIRLLADREGSLASRWPAVPSGQSVILAVGPEGGFTPLERQRAELAGWLAISLGVNTLRIETAGLAGCAALLARVREPE